MTTPPPAAHPPSTILVLETARLRLRPFAPTDAVAVRRLAGAPEVAATTLNIPHPYPEGAAEQWIGGHTAAAAEGRGFTWAIVRQADDELLGAVGCIITPAHARAELGYWLGVPYWNQGYMTESVRRVVAFGFASLGLHRIQSTALPRNVASWRVMEKAGLRREGILRSYVRKNDLFEDIVIYALLRTDAAAAPV
ncbi:MAG: GNAT family N-acetyltransferase [Chloroflexota bacterium]|nr:GNAT family N-acetyltransferase [Chloroflexota bacterium]